jgi:hypothetical protein
MSLRSGAIRRRRCERALAIACRSTAAHSRLSSGGGGELRDGWGCPRSVTVETGGAKREATPWFRRREREREDGKASLTSLMMRSLGASRGSLWALVKSLGTSRQIHRIYRWVTVASARSSPSARCSPAASG